MNDAPENPIAPSRDEGWRAGPKQSEGWSRKKWLTVIAIIFAVHVAIIFSFGEKKPAAPRAIKNVPSLKLTADSDEMLALDDPTLFALPHLEGFAGWVWSNQQLGQFRRLDWTEQPRWLPLPSENLGEDFNRFMQTNSSASRALDFKPEPKLSVPQPIESAPAQDSSTMQVEGELAQRQLPGKMDLPSLQYDDVLAPSKVQVLVDASGDVISTALLESSGFKDADDKALELARAARFAPASGMTIGKMIFNWRTIPLAATNPPASPS